MAMRMQISASTSALSDNIAHISDICRIYLTYASMRIGKYIGMAITDTNTLRTCIRMGWAGNANSSHLCHILTDKHAN